MLDAYMLSIQLCLTLCDSMDRSPPGSSVHGIPQARILEWIAIPFSRGSSPCRDQTLVSCTAGRFLTIKATREAQNCVDQGLTIKSWADFPPCGELVCLTSTLFRVNCTVFYAQNCQNGPLAVAQIQHIFSFPHFCLCISSVCS